MALTANLALNISSLQQSVQSAQRSMTATGAHAKQVGANIGPGLFGGLPGAAAAAGKMLKFAFKEFGSGMFRQMGANIAHRFVQGAKPAGPLIAQNLYGPVPAAARRAAQESNGIFKQIGIGAFREIGANFVDMITQIGPKIREGLKEGISQQQLEMSFSALTPDGNGAGIFERLREDALRTGMAIEDMAGPVRKFMAMDMGASEALKLNKSLLDIGGATGQSAAEIGLIANALSQVKSKGVAAMEELRGQIGERGIPIFRALAEALDVDEPELFKRIKDGKVMAEDVIGVFRDMTGPFAKFAGGAERIGSTVGGMLGRIGQEFVDLKRIIQFNLLEPLTPVFEYLLTKMQELKAGIQTAVDYVKAAAWEIQGACEPMGLIGELIEFGFIRAVNTLYSGLVGVVAVFKSLFSKSVMDVMSLIKDSLSSSFMAVVMDTASELASLFSGLKFVGKTFQGISDKAAERATGHRILAEEWKQQAAGKISNVTEEIIEALRNAPQTYQTAAAGAGPLIDQTESRANLAGSIIRIMGKAADLAKERAGRQGIPEYEKGEGKSGAASSGRASAPNSVWDALLGRSPQDALVKESQTQTGLLKSIDKKIGEKKPESRPPLADTRPRFGK